MPDDIRTQAATYIDGEHRRIHDDLIHEHRRQEQRMRSWEKSRLESHARNREVSQLRYAQRLRTIEERRDRIADRIQAAITAWAAGWPRSPRKAGSSRPPDASKAAVCRTFGLKHTILIVFLAWIGWSAGLRDTGKE
jgi:hypothetical protein